METVKNMLKKFKDKIRTKKLTKSDVTAFEKITAIIGFINKFARIVGIEFEDDWHFTSRSLWSLVMNMLIAGVEFSSFLQLAPDLDCIPVIGGVAFTLAVSTKFVVVMWCHKKFMSMLNFISKVFNENHSGARELILIKTAIQIAARCGYVFKGLCIAFVVYSFYPCYDFVFNGKLTLISPLIYPFIDDTTLSGYLASTTINVVIVSWNFCGIYATSCIFLTFVDVYDGLVCLVEDDFQRFDSLWTKTGQLVVDERKLAFKNILMQLMDLARYVYYMNELFSVVVTVQIGSAYFGIVTVLFAYLINDYIGGLGAVFYFFIELMMFCSIGQLLDNTKSKLEMVVINANWYLYTNKYQKDILFVLNICQNVKPICIANLYQLNFETGLWVVNSIYSFLMFVLSVLE